MSERDRLLERIYSVKAPRRGRGIKRRASSRNNIQVGESNRSVHHTCPSSTDIHNPTYVDFSPAVIDQASASSQNVLNLDQFNQNFYNNSRFRTFNKSLFSSNEIQKPSPVDITALSPPEAMTEYRIPFHQNQSPLDFSADGKSSMISLNDQQAETSTTIKRNSPNSSVKAEGQTLSKSESLPNSVLRSITRPFATPNLEHSLPTFETNDQLSIPRLPSYTEACSSEICNQSFLTTNNSIHSCQPTSTSGLRFRDVSSKKELGSVTLPRESIEVFNHPASSYHSSNQDSMNQNSYLPSYPQTVPRSHFVCPENVQEYPIYSAQYNENLHQMPSFPFHNSQLCQSLYQSHLCSKCNPTYSHYYQLAYNYKLQSEVNNNYCSSLNQQSSYTSPNQQKPFVLNSSSAVCNKELTKQIPTNNFNSVQQDQVPFSRQFHDARLSNLVTLPSTKQQQPQHMLRLPSLTIRPETNVSRIKAISSIQSTTGTRQSALNEGYSQWTSPVYLESSMQCQGIGPVTLSSADVISSNPIYSGAPSNIKQHSVPTVPPSFTSKTSTTSTITKKRLSSTKEAMCCSHNSNFPCSCCKKSKLGTGIQVEFRKDKHLNLSRNNHMKHPSDFATSNVEPISGNHTSKIFSNVVPTRTSIQVDRFSVSNFCYNFYINEFDLLNDLKSEDDQPFVNSSNCSNEVLSGHASVESTLHQSHCSDTMSQKSKSFRYDSSLSDSHKKNIIDKKFVDVEIRLEKLFQFGSNSDELFSSTIEESHASENTHLKSIGIELKSGSSCSCKHMPDKKLENSDRHKAFTSDSSSSFCKAAINRNLDNSVCHLLNDVIVCQFDSTHEQAHKNTVSTSSTQRHSEGQILNHITVDHNEFDFSKVFKLDSLPLSYASAVFPTVGRQINEISSLLEKDSDALVVIGDHFSLDSIFSGTDQTYENSQKLSDVSLNRKTGCDQSEKLKLKGCSQCEFIGSENIIKTNLSVNERNINSPLIINSQNNRNDTSNSRLGMERLHSERDKFHPATPTEETTMPLKNYENDDKSVADRSQYTRSFVEDSPCDVQIIDLNPSSSSPELVINEFDEDEDLDDIMGDLD